MIELAIAIWILIGMFGMCYAWTREKDLTLGMGLYLCFVGSVIGPLTLISALFSEYPVVIWRKKK